MSNDIKKKSFLIVDDFGDMRGMLRSMVQSFGAYDITTASNGNDAVAELKKKRYDVVLCDYNLGPGKDGQQVLEEARQRELIGLDAIFVMITAESTSEMVMGAVEYEPDSYLTKPFPKDLLKSRLDKLLEKKSDLKEIEIKIRNKEYEQAVVLLDKKIEQSPKNLGELIKLKAETFLKLGNNEQAAEIYKKILEERDLPWARLGLGKANMQQGHHVEAKAIFQDLIEENERLMAAYDCLAQTHQAMGEQKSAQQVLEKAVEMSPKAIIRQRALGETALRTGDTEIAEKAFAKAVRIGRNSIYKHPSLYANLAQCKIKTRSGVEGLKVLKDLKKAFKNDDQAALYAAITETSVQKKLGKDDAAEKCAKQASELFQTLGHQVSPDLSISMAKVYNEIGDQEMAAEVLQQAVKNNHSEEMFLKDVEAAFEDMGLSNASELISNIQQEIVQINNRGVALARDGKIDDAIALFDEAAEGMPGNKIVNLNAAQMIIVKMKQQGPEAEGVSNARKFLDVVKRVDPQNHTLRKLQALLQRVAQS